MPNESIQNIKDYLMNALNYDEVVADEILRSIHEGEWIEISKSPFDASGVALLIGGLNDISLGHVTVGYKNSDQWFNTINEPIKPTHFMVI